MRRAKMNDAFEPARLAVINVWQESNNPVGRYLDTEKVIRAVFEALDTAGFVIVRKSDTSS
jgi:hypothetical protein